MKRNSYLARVLSLVLVLAVLLPAAARADFTDVSSGSAEYDAIQWAFENGVAYGVGSGSFRPEAPCTVAAFVTFLWRMCGAPDASAGEGWWSDAVVWARDKGILLEGDELTAPLGAQEMSRMLKSGGAGTGTVTRGEAISAIYAAVSSGEFVYRRDIPVDSEEFTALSHEVFLLNHLDVLLQKHESVTFDLTDVPENDYDWREYFYITRDACYAESPYGAAYDYDRVFYHMNYAYDDTPAQLLYGFDMTSNYDLFEEAGYQFVPKNDEKAWSGNEHEEHVACYIADGRLYFRDKADAEFSAEWFAEHLPFETYSGETMYNEVVADAETKEIYEFNYYLQGADGAMKRVSHETAAYDEPEPSRVSNMVSAFERYCENTIDATVVVDPGTEREFSKTLTIPVGSVVNFRCDNQSGTISADDPDVTKLTHWDGMVSKTVYLFTQPTDEQVERYYDLLTQLIEEMHKKAEQDG